MKLQVEKFGVFMEALEAGDRGLKVATKALEEGNVGTVETERALEACRDVLSVWLDQQVGSFCRVSTSRNEVDDQAEFSFCNSRSVWSRSNGSRYLSRTCCTLGGILLRFDEATWD